MPGASADRSSRRPAAKAASVTRASSPAAKKAPTAARSTKAPAKALKATKPVAKAPAKAVKATKPVAKAPAKAVKAAPKGAKAAAKVTPGPAKLATKVAQPAKPGAPAPTAVPATKAPAAKITARKAVAAVPPRPLRGVATKLPKATGKSKKTVICELSGFEVTPGAPQLAAKTLDRLRQKLLDEKDRLLRQSEELAAEAEQLAREREAGDTQFDEESGEGDTVNIERERDLLLSATARQVVEEIDEALVRIKKGTYGVCKYAGRKISLERLEAIPWANVCVDCKARAERRR